MLWFNFIPGLNFISHCFGVIIIHYLTPKQREIKFKPGMKLNHSIYMYLNNVGMKNLLEEVVQTSFLFSCLGPV